MRIVIVDLETTGLISPELSGPEHQPRIIELAMVDVLDGRIATKYSTLVDPEIEYEKKIIKITGIHPEELKEAPIFAEVLPAINTMFSKADAVLSHNASFDLGVLKHESARVGMELILPENLICTVQEYTPRFGRRPKLTELYKEIVGEELLQQHRALADCMALHAILEKDGFYGLWSNGSSKS